MGLTKEPAERHLNRIVFLATDEELKDINSMVADLHFKDRTELIRDALVLKIAAWNKNKEW